MPLHTGACHCGAITVEFETSLASDIIDIRACQCSFCRRHGAHTVSDPNGSLTLYFDEANVNRYRFATGTLDILLCKNCGCYVGAVTPDNTHGVINLIGVHMTTLTHRTARPVDYAQTSATERQEAHLARWTPAQIKPMKTV